MFKKNMLTLHSQMRNGSLAQLNRASDYGSEGYRFESCANHKKEQLVSCSFSLYMCCNSISIYTKKALINQSF